MFVKNISFEPGYIVVTFDSGPPKQYSIADFLRAAEIPDLTINSLSLLTTLAQVVMVLTKTLIEKEILDESLVSGFDMQYVLDTLIDELKAEEV